MNFAKSSFGTFRGLSTAVIVAVVAASGFVYLTTEKIVDAGPTLTSGMTSPGARCSEESLRGEYAVHGEGWVPGGPPGSPLVPFADVSLMTLDGNGGLTNDITVSRNGVISRSIDSGTYSVEENCTGTITINISTPPFQLTFDLVVADNGKEFVFIATTPSVVNHQARRL